MRSKLKNKIQSPFMLTKFQKKELLAAISVFAFFGFLDATYLTILHYKNLVPNCTVFTNCEIITTSQYSVILGIPIALSGSIYYLSLIFFSIFLLLHFKKQLEKIFYGFVVTGFIVSLILFLIQLLILKSFCQYCILSELIMLFILSLTEIRRRKSLSESI